MGVDLRKTLESFDAKANAKAKATNRTKLREGEGESESEALSQPQLLSWISLGHKEVNGY